VKNFLVEFFFELVACEPKAAILELGCPCGDKVLVDLVAEFSGEG
jgi:hypothetical protein